MVPSSFRSFFNINILKNQAFPVVMALLTASDRVNLNVGASVRSFASGAVRTWKAVSSRFHPVSDGSYAFKKSGTNHNFAKKKNSYRSKHIVVVLNI